MELHQAYKVFDIPTDSTIEDLEKKYDILLRRESDQARLDKIHEAYRIIYDHLLSPNEETEKTFKKKVENFFFHYKAHVIFGTLALIIFVSFAYTLIDGQIEKKRLANLPPPQLEVMMFGEYSDEDLSVVEERTLELLPDWDNVTFEIVYAPGETSSEFDIGALQKSVVIMATERPDMYIFDVNNYQKFIDDGPFLALNELNGELPNDNISESQLKYFQQETDDLETLYGIDLIDHELFQGLAMEDKNKIAFIREGSDNEEYAIEFLSKVIQ